MDLSTARTELRNRGFTDLSDTRANIFLNAAKNMFEDMYPWPWLETTATGTAPLTVSDMKSVLMVSDTSRNNVLVGMERAQILRIDPSLIDTSAPPIYWYPTSTDTVRIWPASTGTSLSVLYIKFSPELSGSDAPLIPTRYHNLWIDFAAVEAYRDNDEHDTANGLLSATQSRVLSVANVYMNRNWQNGVMFQPTFASEDW